MDAKGYSRIPRELCYWITFLAEALPLRSVGTFIELLIGAMLTPAGFVTEAYLVVTMRNHWSSYYKWLQKGRWSWLGLSRQFVRLILKVVKQEVIHLVIDDTLTLRASKKAPGSQIHHQHGNKPNLAQYVRGQCWVSLAWVIRREKQPVALPLLTRLVPGISNTGKRVAAKTLIRAVYRLLDGRKVRVLVDSWYMRRIFIESMLARGFDVIGQVRIDTRLYDEPPKRKKGQRGRPRKYGRKYTPKRIAHLKRSMVTLPLYGKEQEVRYRSKVLMAHFLGGRLVRVVWCEFKSESGHWKKAHLLLSTDAKLTPEQIIEAYGERWSIESKCVFGLVIDFGTSQSPKSTRPLTTYLCPSRPGHQALRNNFASSLLLRTWLPMTGRRVRRPTLFSLWRKARRENSAASRLLGSTSLRFALHGWQRMFNQLKLSWGLKEAWQQTRQTLHRWVHLTLVGYGLIQLLGYLDDQTVRQLCCHSPWRKDNPTTAGQIRKGLLLIFHHVPVRQWWNRKCRKFEPPNWRGSEQDAAISV